MFTQRMKLMSVRNLIMVVIAVFAAQNCVAQTEFTITKSGNEFAAKLIEEKVDSIVTYNYPDYRSEPWEHAYVIWKKDGKTQLYIDYNKETKTISEETAAGVWNFLATNLKAIKTEKVKPFSSMIKVKGRNVVETIPTMDSEWWKCWIYLKGETTKISQGESPFHKKSTDNKGKVKMNINYEYNIKLKEKLFVDLLDEVLEM
jgi:hypothetical protein